MVQEKVISIANEACFEVVVAVDGTTTTTEVMGGIGMINSGWRPDPARVATLQVRCSRVPHLASFSLDRVSHRIAALHHL